MGNELDFEIAKVTSRKTSEATKGIVRAESMTKSWRGGIEFRGIDLDRSRMCIPPQKSFSHMHNVIMHTREICFLCAQEFSRSIGYQRAGKARFSIPGYWLRIYSAFRLSRVFIDRQFVLLPFANSTGRRIRKLVRIIAKDAGKGSAWRARCI